MKLYGTDHSPFVARVQMAAQALGIALELIAPPGGPSSAEYRAIVPTGMVPALILDDGTVLPESEVIVEYLQERAATGGALWALLPADPADRARARLLARLADLYLAEPLRALFEEAKLATPGPAALAATVPRIRAALELLDRHIGAGIYAVGARLSSADCALVPLLYFVARCEPLARHHDGVGVFDAVTRVRRYFARIGADPIAVHALDTMAAAQARRAEERARTGTNSIR